MRPSVNHDYRPIYKKLYSILSTLIGLGICALVCGYVFFFSPVAVAISATHVAVDHPGVALMWKFYCTQLGSVLLYGLLSKGIDTMFNPAVEPVQTPKPLNWLMPKPTWHQQFKNTCKLTEKKHPIWFRTGCSLFYNVIACSTYTLIAVSGYLPIGLPLHYECLVLSMAKYSTYYFSHRFATFVTGVNILSGDSMRSMLLSFVEHEPVKCSDQKRHGMYSDLLQSLQVKTSLSSHANLSGLSGVDFKNPKKQTLGFFAQKSKNVICPASKRNASRILLGV